MVEPIFLGALLNKLTYIYNIITKMVYEISMNQNGKDIVKVTNEVYSTHTVTDKQTHRQTMAVEVNKLKKNALTSYPFGTSFAKHM